MKKKIFISYSHKDEAWKDRLVTQLNVLALEGFYDVWEDRRIEIGDTWRTEIETALNEANIAILLISADFLTSKFIRDEEVPRLLEWRNNEGVWVIPVFVKPCAWKKVKRLASIQGIPRDGKSLEEINNPGQVDKILADLVEKISERIEAGTQAEPPKSQPTIATLLPKSVNMTNPFTDTHVIQEAGRFIGREKEMKSLLAKLQNGFHLKIDESLLSQGASVVLMGEPKIGKSSLLYHLKREWEKARGKIIGPINMERVDSTDDFRDRIAKGIGVDKRNWSVLEERLLKFQGLLLIDKLHIGLKHGVTNKDIRHLRGIVEENRSFKVVVTSRIDLKNVYQDSIGSYPTDFLESSLLGMLDEKECLILLTHPWSPDAPQFDSQTCEKLLNVAGCHPFKLQRAAHHRFKTLIEHCYDWLSEFKREMEQFK